MNSFKGDLLERQPIPHSLLRTVRLLGEYRGKEALFIQQTPQVLESLRQVAIIQSTESSNRIEGIEAPVERIKKLIERKTTPRNRSEQEIAGYRDALATIHANHANMPFTSGVVLQLHREPVLKSDDTSALSTWSKTSGRDITMHSTNLPKAGTMAYTHCFRGGNIFWAWCCSPPTGNLKSGPAN